MDFLNFLSENHFHIVKSPGDGHCLVHSLSRSIFYQLGRTTDYHDVKCRIFAETIKNRNQYIQFLQDVTPRSYVQLVKNYLFYKHYNNTFGDILPMIIANAYHINLAILDEYNDGTFRKVEVNAIKPSECTLVYLHRFKDHYNGIAPYRPRLIHTSLDSQNTYKYESNSTGLHNVEHTTPHKSSSAPKTITYSSDKLRSLAPEHSRITRELRKTIFSHGLWKPGKSTISSNFTYDKRPWDVNSGVHKELLKSLPRSDKVYCSDHKLQLAIVNARSLRNKTQDFLHHAISKDLDVCIISETWLNDNDSPTISAMQNGGYKFENIDRSGSHRGGGLGILYKSSINVERLNTTHFATFEMGIWKLKFRKTEIVVAAVYRPPYSSKHRKTVPMFIAEFSDTLSHILARYNNNRLLLAGDYNIHMDDSNNSDTKAFLELLDNLDCQQHVDCQTHESGHTIDLLISPRSTSLDISSPTVDYYISDHAFVEFQVSLPKPTIIKKEVQSRALSKINGQSFSDDLSAIVSIINTTDASSLATEYNDRLSELLDRHAPMLTKRVTVRPTVAWFDHDAKIRKRDVRRLYHKWKSSKDDEDHATYKKARNSYRHHLDENKRQHFSDAILSAQGNPRKLFSITMGLMGKKVSNPLPSSGADQELANEFANFFIDKVRNLQNSLEDHPAYNPSGSCSSHLTAFKPLTDNAVSKIIACSKATTCLLDPLPSQLVKDNKHLLSPVIARIINNSLQKGSFYDEWKTAVVTPLLKKQGLDPLKSNYRPVSNLSFISKLAEKGVIQQLNDHFTINNLHSCHQSAYKQNFSTETALCILVNDLLWSMEKAEVSILVALDLSAAFDTVDHNVLCSLLHRNFGIRGPALDWIQSYLTDRKLKVKVNDATSSLHTFNYSVPQGSCLGPVLFNAYVSTITTCIPDSLTLGGYADDHFIKSTFNPADPSSSAACINIIEETLQDVQSWMSANRLKMNPAKTEVITFGSPCLIAKQSISSINVAGDEINTSDCIKYLGAYLDATLSFKEFIKQKCKIAVINIRNISQIRKYIDIKTAKQLASSLILSHLDYSNNILSGLPASTLKPLQGVQNWAARTVLCRSKYDSAREALQQLHWLPIRERIDFKVACLVFKCLNNMAPSPLSDLLSPRIYTRHTRASVNDNSELYVPLVKKNTFASRSFSVYGPTIWNTLPPNLRINKDFGTFKKHLKTFLFRRAFNDSS